MRFNIKRVIGQHIISKRWNSGSSNPLTFNGKPEKYYDAIIIGAGHNGLVSAAYLQKSGKKVCVLERRHVIGGAAVTEEMVPGFKFSRASYLLSLLRPAIINELELHKHGLKLHMRNPSSYTPLCASQWKGKNRSLTLSSDPEFNKAQIAKFSLKDAEAIETYENWLGGIVSALEPLLDNHPVDLSSGTLLDKCRNIFLATKSARKIGSQIPAFYELLTAPAAKILNRFFESEPLKATLATDAVIGAMLSPNCPGSSYVLLHHVMGEVGGVKGAWAYPEGGMGAVSLSIAKSAIEKGASIFTNQSVKEILLNSRGEAEGVVLASGDIVRAKAVLSNATPKVTFLDLLPKGSLPEVYEKSVRDIDYTSPVTKINVALKKLPSFLADPTPDGLKVAAPHHRCTIHINCEDMGIIDEAYRQGSQGIIPERPVIEMVIPSSLDSTLAPPGCHVALLFTQYTPYTLQGNQSWNSELKEAYARKVFSQIDEYAPGFQESVVGYEVLTPPDLENIFGLTGGNIFHGAMRLDQLYFTRPFGSWQRGERFPILPKSPVKNLYVCGSGGHPGGGVMGTPGKLAAQQVIADFK